MSTIKVEFRLINWSYMNFTLELPITTQVFTLKKHLKERHGNVNLTLCYDAFAAANELTDDLASLADYVSKDTVIYYEFKTKYDPLLFW